MRRVIGNDSIVLAVGDLVDNELLLVDKDLNVTASVLLVTKKLWASLGSDGHGSLREKSPMSPDIGLHAQILFYHQGDGRAAHVSLLGQDGHWHGQVGGDGALQACEERGSPFLVRSGLVDLSRDVPGGLKFGHTAIDGHGWVAGGIDDALWVKAGAVHFSNNISAHLLHVVVGVVVLVIKFLKYIVRSLNRFSLSGIFEMV